MDLTETSALTAWVRALKPAQQMTTETPIAWQAVLADVSLDDAKAAVVELAREKSWIEPVDIASRVRSVRARRLADARFAEWVPNVDPDDAPRWAAELRALRDAVASGRATAADREPYEAGLVPPLTGGPAWRSGVPVLRDRPVSALLGVVVGSDQRRHVFG